MYCLYYPEFTRIVIQFTVNFNFITHLTTCLVRGSSLYEGNSAGCGACPPTLLELPTLGAIDVLLLVLSLLPNIEAYAPRNMASLGLCATRLPANVYNRKVNKD